MKNVLSENTKSPKSPRDSSAGFKIQFFPFVLQKKYQKV